jgi:two-component system phosphate regulon sensor histidine kinase PhoR
MPRPDTIDAATLFARIEETVRPLSNGRHTLTFDIEPKTTILGSESELTSAFTNLVTNAIRYTPERGSITVVWARTVDGGAALTVTDTGIGIPQQHLPRLTERFYRVDRSRSRQSGGTGLGLAIVKHVMTRHQGTLAIASEVGHGSTFTAWLPPQRIMSGTPTGARGSDHASRADTDVDVEALTAE